MLVVYLGIIKNEKPTDMKISAKQIEKGMTIKVVDILPHWKIEGLMSVDGGSIKKNSPVLEVVEVEEATKETHYHNGRKVGLGNVIFRTACGKKVEISTRQKVEVVS